MNETSASAIEAGEDLLLPIPVLATRWNCGAKVAAKRAEAQGVPLIRWNKRVVCARLSDILKAEEAAMTQ
jgi:hypothetical protein